MTTTPNQASFIRQYNDKYREPFNDELFRRSDDDIIEELKKVILSCERSKYFTLKVSKFTVIDDYGTIIDMLREQEKVKTDSKDKSYNRYDYISLDDSDIRLLVVDYYIKVQFPKKDTNGEKNLRVLIMVPRFVDKYYFKIFGKYYCPKYQIVDGSTYNNAGTNKCQNVTFKSLFMATRIYKYTVDCNFERESEPVHAIYYNSSIFNKMVPVMKYILAKYGVIGTMRALGVSELYIQDFDPENPDWYTLKRYGVYISMPKFIFLNDQVAQSLMYTIYLSITSKEFTADMMWTTDFWLRSLGESYSNKTVEKGESVLESLESIYDIPTREALRLPDEYKQNIYHVLIWIIREFADLRKKNNLDVSTKRRRLAEYIAALYAVKLSSSMFNLSDDGVNIQVNQIEKRIYTFPDFLLKVITKDRIVNGRNNVNNMDAFGAIKWSFKGQSGLGESKDSAIPDAYKQIHVSYAGRLDLDSSSPNDPGMSGMMCPMAQTFDNYFSDYSEPNDWRESVREMMVEYKKLANKKQIFTLQRAIGLAPDQTKEEMVDETIRITEERILPFIIHVDEEMTDIDVIK
jgi:hypothetical protein